MFDSASSFSALVGIAVDVVILFMALLSFVESAPRAYRLKVSNAVPSNFNIKRDDSQRTETLAQRNTGVFEQEDAISSMMLQI
jgi:hypothetical protein